MSKENEELISALQKMGRQPVSLLVGTVKEVRTSNDLECDVEVNGLTYYNVSLKAVLDGGAEGFYLIPSVGSVVVIGRQFEGANFCIMATTMVDEIYLKGDQYGGLVRVEDLTTKLNNLENLVNSLISKYNAHVHTAPSGATGIPSVTEGGSLTPTNRTEIENEYVQHGTS